MQFDPVLPRVAVLMASFNGAQWIHAQIQSILGCAGVKVHIFISDDGSSDGTLDVVKQQDPRLVTLLSAKRMGGAGQNFLRLVRDAPWDHYDYIAFADQDDLWDASKLKRAISLIKEYQLDAYSSDVTAFWPDGRRKSIIKSQPQQKYDHLFEAGGPGNTYVLPHTSAYRLRDILCEVEPSILERVASHDWFIYAFFRNAGARWHIDLHSSVDYRQHENNVLGAASGLGAIRRRLASIKSDSFTTILLAIADILKIGHPAVEFMRNPSVFRLLPLLWQTRRFRRKGSEALALGVIFIWLAFRRKRQDS